jgi:hypothetical protein
MKTKDILFLFIVSLFGCGYLSAQQSLFYYYKGNPIPLNVNSQHFLVYADTNMISRDLFAKEYLVTEWIEDGGIGILEAQVNIPNDNYDSVINVLKAKDCIIDVEPVIGDNEMINTSRVFYVKLHDSQDYPLLNAMALRTGAEIRGEVPFCENWYELRVSKKNSGNSIETANLFWESHDFAGIDPGFIFHFEPASVTTCVSDSRFDEQWGMQVIKACSAWKITKGDTNVRIAVIDKGIDESHREFDSTYVVFSFDMDTSASPARFYCEEQLEVPTRDHSYPSDPPVCVHHGINVGGVIFANHNRDSVAGVCPNAGLINISYSFKYGENSIAKKTAQAINMSVLNGARVINNSWKIKDTINQVASEMLEDAIDSAIVKNCIVVFAAGNDMNGSVSYPASCNSDILTVGAVTNTFERLYCSNYGFGLDIVAPGSEILSTHNDNGYSISQGTSMAAPHVSGVAGLMFSINPGLTGKEVRDIIEQTTKKNPDYGPDTLLENGTWYSYFGYGLLDAHRAVLKAAYHKVYGDTALTLCDTSRHPYTVRAPHNANIDSVSFFWTCSDNLQMVSGQNTDSVWVKRINSGFAQLQCHIVHDGDTVITTLDIPIVSGKTVYDNISLSSSLTFPDTFILSREVAVDSLINLTWQDKTVLCTPDCRLIVRPGGKLVIDGGRLTSACPGEMWQGIEVVGDHTKRQIPQWQGTVELRDSAVVENAFCAIRTRLRGDASFATTGGIILADSAYFTNNRRAVEINPYTNHSPAGTIADNVCYFERCTFTVDSSNLFAANGTAFTEHVKLWDVRGVKFRGCTFQNRTVSPVSNGRGVYAEDAGVKVRTACASYLPTIDCECHDNPRKSVFSGFTTAVEVNTTGNQFAVTVDEAQFENNTTGVRINGNQFVTVTRCDFDLENSPLLTANRCGLCLDNCTGYHVEENNFHKQSVPEQGERRRVDGIVVNNSNGQPNELYRNMFTHLSDGIYVMGNNSSSRSGLMMTCDTFSSNRYDIFVSAGATVWQYQGGYVGADNSFDHTIISSFYNAGSQNVLYAYSNGNIFHIPYNPYNIVTYDLSSANGCEPNLCYDGSVPRSLSQFQSDMDADDYFNAVRTLMSDTVLNLNELELWHTAAQPIADPYSLTETRFMEGYAEPFIADADDAEMANYAEFHALKLALRDNGADNVGTVEANNYSPLQTGHPDINWYALTPTQIAQLQTIAERNTGRASVMAKGVLCFFFGICYEDDLVGLPQCDSPTPGEDTTDVHTKRAATNIADDAALTVYPNPAGDILHIELSGAEIANVALYDLQGRVVTGTHAGAPQPGTTTTVNLRNVPAGVYLLRVRDAEGKEYYSKIVKR